MAVTLDSIVVASPRQVSYQLEDELVVLAPDGSGYYGLRGTAGRIWRLLEEPRSVREILDQLVREFEIERDRCAAELLDVLRELRASELVDVVE